MTPTLDLVRTFYPALAKSDAQALLDLLQPEPEWTEAQGFPYFSGNWNRPEDVLNKLLMRLMRDWDAFSAVADDLITQGDRVVCLGAYRGISKATGNTMNAVFAHVWRVADGKLKCFDIYADTPLVHRAMQA